MPTTRNRLLTNIVPPVVEPLSLTETKLYLRIDGNTEDSLIGNMIISARISAEQWLKRSLIEQSWKLSFDDYLAEETPLFMGPVLGITSVNVIARDETSQTISDSTYYLNAAKNILVLDSIIFGFRVEIIYSAGYGADASTVPQPIKLGMLEHVAAMYDNRGEIEVSGIPDQTLQHYLPFREIAL